MDTPTKPAYTLAYLESEEDLHGHLGKPSPENMGILFVARAELNRLQADEAYRHSHSHQYLVVRDGKPEWHKSLVGVDVKEITAFHYTIAPYTGSLDMLLVEEEPEPLPPDDPECLEAIEWLSERLRERQG